MNKENFRSFLSYLLGITLFFLIIFHIPSIINGYTLPKLMLVYTATVCTLLCFVLVSIREKKLHIGKYHILILIFMMFYWVNTFLSKSILPSVFGYYTHEGLNLIPVLCYAVIGFGYSWMKPNQRSMVKEYCIAGTTISSLQAITEYFFSGVRPNGLEGQPILSAVVIALGLLTVFTFLRSNERTVPAPVYWIILAIHVTALYCLSSWSVIGAIGAAVMISGLVGMKYNQKKVLIGVSIVIAVIIFSVLLLQQKSFSVSQRVTEYKTVGQFILQERNIKRILFGNGPGMTVVSYRAARSPSENLTKEKDWETLRVRNNYLEFYSTLGILGLGSWLGFLLYVFKSAEKRKFFERSLFIFLLIWQFFYYLTPLVFVFVFIVAADCVSGNKNQSTVSLKREKKYIFIPVFLLITVLLIVYMYSLVKAEFSVKKGEFEKAYHAAPYYPELLYTDIVATLSRVKQARDTVACFTTRTCDTLYLATLYRNSISTGRQVVSLDPTYPDFHDTLATLLFYWYYDTGSKKEKYRAEALKHLQIAVQLEPTNARYADGLGLLYLDMREYKKAEYYFQLSQHLDPTYQMPQSHLKELLKQIGKM